MTNTMTATTTCTPKDFADVKFFLPYYIDYSKCFHSLESHTFCYLSDLSKVDDLDDQQKANISELETNNIAVLLEYPDNLKEKDLTEKHTNVCFYDLESEQIISRYPNQKIGNHSWYDILDFVCDHLPDKTAEGLVEVEKITAIEPNIKALFDELQKYNLFQFYFMERDNNGDKVTFSNELISNKIKLDGCKIDFLVEHGESRHSTLSIHNNICKIERKFDEKVFSDRFYDESYTFTVYFNNSDTPLEFYVSKNEHRKEVK